MLTGRTKQFIDSPSTLMEQTMTKTFAAIGTGGFVLFAFGANGSKEARSTVQSIKSRSETVQQVRLLRDDDMGPGGGAIEVRA